MKAAVITGPEQAEIVRTPAPDPEPGEIVVRLEGCGVCASNLPLWQGREWFSYPVPPGAPGHEGWGRVHALGPGARGKIVIAGFHQDGPRQVNLQLWNWKGIDVINAHERDPRRYLEGIKQGIQAVSSGELSLAGLITHQFELEQVALAYRTLSERPDGFLKGVIRL